MAHANNTNRGAVAAGVLSHPLIPRGAFVTPHGCLFPPSSITIINPIFPPVVPLFDYLVPFYRCLSSSPSFRLPLNSVILFRMDEEKSISLQQFIVDEGLVPSRDDELRRIDVLRKLKQIISVWIKKIASQRQLPTHDIAVSSAKLLTYGSYGLGVHGPESDIDALCVAPYFASINEDFFTVLYDMLKIRSEVSEINCVKDAKVPLMRLKFDGISIDLPFAQINMISVPENIDEIGVSVLKSVDETSWKSLSGVLANTFILKTVPDLEKYKAVLRCIKLWAKRRGVYGNLFGFLGGIHLAIMTAYVCLQNVGASLNSLITTFFKTFALWNWPNPVALHDSTILVPPLAYMPILLPSNNFPSYCHSNISASTFFKIKAELQYGMAITRDITRPGWDTLFAPYPYLKSYTHFVRICLAAPAQDKLSDWAGWVKSRFPLLILKLEEGNWMCDPNPTEYGDAGMEPPNVVFYWGLLAWVDSSNRRGISAVEADFRDAVKGGSGAVLDGTVTLTGVRAGQVPKEAEDDRRGRRPAWRIFDPRQGLVPVYSQHSPRYLIGYAAPADRRP